MATQTQKITRTLDHGTVTIGFDGEAFSATSDDYHWIGYSNVNADDLYDFISYATDVEDWSDDLSADEVFSQLEEEGLVESATLPSGEGASGYDHYATDFFFTTDAGAVKERINAILSR